MKSPKVIIAVVASVMALCVAVVVAAFVGLLDPFFQTASPISSFLAVIGLSGAVSAASIAFMAWGSK